MKGIWLLLGTNLGDRKANLEKAIYWLSQQDILVEEYSSIYESEPWGVTNQPWFWNIVLKIVTKKEPESLLASCLDVENKMGRVRKQKWGERLIDIDILYFNDQIINETNLQIPHPGIPERKFTLMPLIEIWPEIIHPVIKKNQSTLLTELNSSMECRKTDVVLNHDID